MNDFLWLWLSLSLSGSLVALALILLKPLLRRLGRTWQYYLWLLVILRLLLPVSPDMSIIGGLFQQMDSQLAQRKEVMEEEPVFQPADQAQTPVTPAAEHTAPSELPALSVIPSLKNHILGIIWITVALTLLIRKIYGYCRFLSAVKKECRINHGPPAASLQMASSHMKIRRKIPVSINPLVRAPMLIGFIRPMIVLPETEIPPSELMLILRHELTHYRRMDFLYKWLVEITVCLHWFNPFVFFIRKQISQDCEFACDETVVSPLEDSQRRTYGEALLNSIVINNTVTGDVVSLSLNEDGKLIKKRLGEIMKYHQKSKVIIFIASVLTSVLLCGTVFAGAYTVSAVESVKENVAGFPIRISGKAIAPGGKVSLGSQSLVSGTECQVLLTWAESSSNLTIYVTPSKGTAKTYPAENGVLSAFQIDTGGKYTIEVKNDTDSEIENVNGSITFHQNKDNPSKSNVSSSQYIVYDNAEMRRYEGEDGHPYVHNIKTNNTTQKITAYQYGMLAFDIDGNPLKIDWWSLDTDAESTYFYLADTSAKIAPGETYDEPGGWSLNFFKDDPEADKIAFVLFCDKEITFEDGTVWTNPDFENWRSTYEGRIIDVDILKNYYPYKQDISISQTSIDLASSGAFRVTAGSGPEQSLDWSEMKQTTFTFAKGQTLKIEVDHISAFDDSSKDNEIRLIFKDSLDQTVEAVCKDGKNSEVVFENAGTYSLSIQNDTKKSLWYSFLLQ